MSEPSTANPIATPRRRWPGILLSLVIFAGGLMVGSGLSIAIAVHHIRYGGYHPEQAPPRIAAFLARRLDLDSKQAQQVEQLIAKHQANLEAIRRDVGPRVDAEIAALRQDIAAILTPEQRSKWDRIFDEALDRWLPPPPPPPGGHGPPGPPGPPPPPF